MSAEGATKAARTGTAEDGSVKAARLGFYFPTLIILSQT
jgi:hypothetical protein